MINFYKKQMPIKNLVGLGGGIAGSSDTSPSYSINVISGTSVPEGDSHSFQVTTSNVDDGTTLYYTINQVTGTITSSDFTSGVLNGSFTINSGSASFSIQTAIDGSSESSEQYNLQIRTDSVSGPIVVTSATVTITDNTPTYSISESSTSQNEGSSVTFTVNTNNVADGTSLNWETVVVSGTVNSSDFSDGATSGSLTINSNTGSVIRTATSDSSTEGSEQYQIRIKDAGNTTVATSQTVTINDTSTTPIVSWTAQYLMLSGGGSGGYLVGGGAGAGAMYYSSFGANSTTSYPVTIGAGAARSGYANQGNQGGTTSFQGYSWTGGGGGGGRPSSYANSGMSVPHGSGGGASAYDYGSGAYGGSGGSYGNPGGNTWNSGGGWGAAGGGGRSGGGAPAPSGPTAGPGGSGAQWPSKYPLGYFAGGGGGANYNGGPVGSGGSGGGKPGSNNSGTAPPSHDGDPATGGGGGGGSGAQGGAGGSGAVYVTHPGSVTLKNPGGGLTWTQYPDYVRIESGSGNFMIN